MSKLELLTDYASWAYSVRSVFDLASSLCRSEDIVALRDHPDAAQYFVFADYSLWGYGFAVYLTGESSATTPVVITVGSPYREVAPSFLVFLQRYLADDQSILAPGWD